MENIENLTLNKGGETSLQISLGRSPRHPEGIVVSVKALPHIEAYMRALSVVTVPATTHGSDAPQEVQEPQITSAVAAGRTWLSLSRDMDLRVYVLQQPFHGLSGDIRMDQVGRPLVAYSGESLGGRDKIVNLSFLLLVGISEGAGVSFVLRGVYSNDQIRSLKDDLLEAVKKFYVQYLKPISLTIQVSTQEIS